MHFAISSRHSEICQMLVSIGANVNISTYVKIQLKNDMELYGTLVDNPDGDDLCLPAPAAQWNKGILSNVYRLGTIIGKRDIF